MRSTLREFVAFRVAASDLVADRWLDARVHRPRHAEIEREIAQLQSLAMGWEIAAGRMMQIAGDLLAHSENNKKKITRLEADLRQIVRQWPKEGVQ